MRIISHFTDFYDFVSKVHGTDNKVVYNRNLKNEINLFTSHLATERFKSSFEWSTLRHWGFNEIWQSYVVFKLIIVGHVYTIANPIAESGWYFVDENHPYYPISGDPYYDHAAKALCVAAKRPIIVVTKRYRDGIVLVSDFDWPLKDVGLAVLDPYFVWQEVYMFLSELYNTEVDTKMTDLEKVSSHGFDKKISFRHRM